MQDNWILSMIGNSSLTPQQVYGRIMSPWAKRAARAYRNGEPAPDRPDATMGSVFQAMIRLTDAGLLKAIHHTDGAGCSWWEWRKPHAYELTNRNTNHEHETPASSRRLDLQASAPVS